MATSDTPSSDDRYHLTWFILEKSVCLLELVYIVKSLHLQAQLMELYLMFNNFLKVLQKMHDWNIYVRKTE